MQTADQPPGSSSTSSRSPRTAMVSRVPGSLSGGSPVRQATLPHPLVRQHALDLVDGRLHLIQILGEQDAAFVEKSHMITDILQLPQVVGSDDRCQIPLRHSLANRLLTAWRITGSRPSKVSSQKR